MVGSKFSGFRENLWICRKHSVVIISTHGPSLLTVTAHLHGRGKKSTFAFTRNTHSHLQEIYICIYKKSTFMFTFNQTHLHPSVSVFGSRGVIVEFFSMVKIVFSSSGISCLCESSIVVIKAVRTYYVGRSGFYQSPMFYFIRALKIDIKGRKKGMG